MLKVGSRVRYDKAYLDEATSHLGQDWLMADTALLTGEVVEISRDDYLVSWWHPNSRYATVIWNNITELQKIK